MSNNQSALTFDPFVLQTFALHFWKWHEISKKLWRRVSSVPPVPPGLPMPSNTHEPDVLVNLKSHLKGKE